MATEQNQLRRIAVQLTDKELREVEKSLREDEAELSRALVDLGNKLKTQSLSKSIPQSNLMLLNALPYAYDFSADSNSDSKQKSIECDSTSNISVKVYKKG